MTDGWIKIHRKFLEWEWFDSPEMVKMFLYLIMEANTQDKRWRGKVIKRGQLVTSQSHLCEKLRFSRQTLRTCLKRLKSTNEITSQSTNGYTLITICKYDTYQCCGLETNQENNQPTNQRLTNEQPTTNQRLTTTKEYKNINNNVVVVDDACAHVREDIQGVVSRFMSGHQQSVESFCMKNKISKKDFGDLMEEVLVDWELTGWKPEDLKKGNGNYESKHFLNTMRIKISERNKQNETNQTDRFQRRRGTDSSAKSRQSFNGTL